MDSLTFNRLLTFSVTVTSLGKCGLLFPIIKFDGYQVLAVVLIHLPGWFQVVLQLFSLTRKTHLFMCALKPVHKGGMVV